MLATVHLDQKIETIWKIKFQAEENLNFIKTRKVELFSLVANHCEMKETV